jgi:tungstate transport system ATP-binding protein
MSLRLSVSNINKNYNGKSVLNDCSFFFDKNEIYILIGPNGSGKSTFLRICALLEEPDKGQVNFLGELKGNVLKNDIALKRRITLLLPKIGVFNTTVINNVAYGLNVRGMKSREVKDKVYMALELVGLNDKRDQNALSLSSGEAQRLGIARAMVVDPEILFLDEPTASLDPHSTTIIEEAITKLKENNRLTIIMVTHNIFQTKRLADTVLFMYDGRIVDHGPNKEFFEKPGDERAYKFITGQMVY